MLHGAMVTWAVNVLELLHEMRDEKKVHQLLIYLHTDMYEFI